MKPGGGLLLVAGAVVATTTSAFVQLPPKQPLANPATKQHPQPLKVKTGNWFGEGGSGRAAEKANGSGNGSPTAASSTSSSTTNPFGAAFASLGMGNPFGELKLALRDALWKADEAIQRIALNESAGESLVAAFQAKLQQAAPRSSKAAEPTVTKFAVASPPPATAAAAPGSSGSSVLDKPKAASVAAAVPPPVTRTPPPPPPPPRMPPTDEVE